MGTGVTGHNGLAVPKPVDQDEEAEQESVTTKLQLMEAKTVQNRIMSQAFVTLMLVGLQQQQQQLQL